MVGSATSLEDLIAQELNWLTQCRAQVSVNELGRQALLEEPELATPAMPLPHTPEAARLQKLDEAEQQMEQELQRLALLEAHEAFLRTQLVQAGALAAVQEEAATLRGRLPPLAARGALQHSRVRAHAARA